MMSAPHQLITPPAGPVSEEPRRSPGALLAELGDVLWLSYYRLIRSRTRLDGFVSHPVHTVDLDGHRLTLPVRRDQVEVRVLHLDGHLPNRVR